MPCNSPSSVVLCPSGALEIAHLHPGAAVSTAKRTPEPPSLFLSDSNVSLRKSFPWRLGLEQSGARKGPLRLEASSARTHCRNPCRTRASAPRLQCGGRGASNRRVHLKFVDRPSLSTGTRSPQTGVHVKPRGVDARFSRKSICERLRKRTPTAHPKPWEHLRENHAVELRIVGVANPCAIFVLRKPSDLRGPACLGIPCAPPVRPLAPFRGDMQAVHR